MPLANVVFVFYLLAFATGSFTIHNTFLNFPILEYLCSLLKCFIVQDWRTNFAATEASKM
jgi:hypothetical protein